MTGSTLSICNRVVGGKIVHKQYMADLTA